MKKNWCNTLLVACSLLPKIVKTLDFGVSSRINSGFCGIHARCGVSTEQLIGEITELNGEKFNILFAADKVRRALDMMDESERDILRLRVYLKMSHKQIAKLKNASERTVFRKLNRAENSFAYNMMTLGCDEKTLDECFGRSRLMKAIKERIENGVYFVAKNS